MSYTVKVEPSGHTFAVEEGETVLAAALRHKYAFPYGCRNGYCGACKGLLVSGEIDYAKDTPGLSDEDRANNMSLLCQAIPRSDLVVQVHLLSSSNEIVVKKYPCRVVKKEQLNHDVVLLKVKLPVTERMQFFAGQYLDILLPDGRRRSFSIANPPHDDEFIELHIRHIDGGDFTSYVFDSMAEKTVLRIEGPLGAFYLREDSDRPLIFMAGGTGFAPIKGIIEHALAEKIDRPIHLYWGARTKGDLYMHELARQWAEQNSNVSYVPVLSEAAAEDHWNGRTGYVHQAIADDFPDMSGYDVYAGGPPAMVYAGKDVFLAQGLQEDHYYSDAFEFQDPKPDAALKA
jgi:CDP-4-dehydro-6-deoxyglucose reductase